MISPIDLLRDTCTAGLSENSSLSEDGSKLTLSGQTIPSSNVLEIPHPKSDEPTVSYTLASVYLQLLNPDRLLQYRKACEAANVEDPVKSVDKTIVVQYFRGAGDQALEEDTAPKKEKDGGVQFSAPKTEEKRSRSSSKDRRRSGSDSRKASKHSRSKSEDSAKKRSKSTTPITNEQLVANLSTIVDKRDNSDALTPSKDGSPGKATPGTDSTQITPAATPNADDVGLDSEKEHQDRELLLSWLSPEGFQVDNPAVAAAIEADREAVQKITALEIPVGDSASILRAGAGGELVDKAADGTSSKKRDFTRALELFHEVDRADQRAKHASSKKRPSPPSSQSNKNPRTGNLSSARGNAAQKLKDNVSKGNPIIIVPNAMTSAITMVNAPFFLGKEATFIPRHQAVKNPAAGKRGGTFSVTRKLAPRLGGAEITYDIIDNPTTRLKKDGWDRVVAVVCQGASWQFKGWRYSDPVDLFSRTFGFFVGLEAAVPKELKSWNVKIGKISRDRRGMDNVCLAGFWNGLEEFMAVHKQGLFKP